MINTELKRYSMEAFMTKVYGLLDVHDGYADLGWLENRIYDCRSGGLRNPNFYGLFYEQTHAFIDIADALALLNLEK